MKSMILKDLYNISQNMKSLVFILIFLAMALIPTSEVLGYVFAASIICSTMVSPPLILTKPAAGRPTPW